jgi:hypothetical protein
VAERVLLEARPNREVQTIFGQGHGVLREDAGPLRRVVRRHEADSEGAAREILAIAVVRAGDELMTFRRAELILQVDIIGVSGFGDGRGVVLIAVVVGLNLPTRFGVENAPISKQHVAGGTVRRIVDD